MFNFKKYFFTEGGAAASSLIDELQLHYNKPLQYVRINSNRIQEIKPFIDEIIDLLKQGNFIMEDPRYTLGSTRLAAHLLGKQITLHGVETPETLKKASQVKQSFGDIDLDIQLMPNKTMKNVGDYFKKQDPTKYAYKKFRDKEINMAVRINDSEVIQIDIVDVGQSRKALEYSQFSSFKDMSLGLKGALREVLVRASARSTPVPNDQEIQRLLYTDKQAQQKIQSYGKSSKTGKQDSRVDVEKIRYSLGDEGLKIAVYLRKTKLKTGKVNKMLIKTNLKDLIDIDEYNTVSYNNLDQIAQILGFTSGDTMYHVSEMVKDIQNFPLERKQKIWDSAMRLLTLKLPTANSAGILTPQEVNDAINFLKPYFKGVNYDNWKKENENI